MYTSSAGGRVYSGARAQVVAKENEPTLLETIQAAYGCSAGETCEIVQLWCTPMFANVDSDNGDGNGRTDVVRVRAPRGIRLAQAEI